MSSPTGSSQWFANPGAGFYNGVAKTSLRLDASADAYLTREFDAPSNNKKWTYSTWIKRSKIGGHQAIISSNVDGNNYFDFRFSATSSHVDQLFLQNRVGGSNLIAGYTAAEFRDPSAWYNIVLIYDSDNSTTASRTLLYVNGVNHVLSEIAADGEASYFNVDGINHNFGASRTSDSSGTVWSEFDGYVSEANFCDGQALGPTSFGETKNGVWIPIDTSGLTFGNNGFRIRHDQVGVGTASTSTIGADVSGKTNHLTSSGIAATDCAMRDSPENNFATWNPLSNRRGGAGPYTMADGALRGVGSTDGNNHRHLFATMPINQVLVNTNFAGVYFEVMVVGESSSYIGLIAGEGNDNITYDGNQRSEGFPKKHLLNLSGYYHDNLVSATDKRSVLTVQTDYDILGFAIKSDGKVFMSKNGTFGSNGSGTQDPANGTNSFSTLDFDHDWFPHAGNSNNYHVNFGQDHTFSGYGGDDAGGGETNAAAADASGHGVFFGTPPAGFVSLCTANMAEPTIGGADSDTRANAHFNTVLYQANSQQAKTVTGLGLRPDWLWIKGRSFEDHHATFDSNRGVTKYFRTSGNDLEFSDNTLVTAFNDDGFVLGTDSSGWVNYGTNTLVAWAWVANASTATATISESGNNPAAVVQANPTAGFSLITYTGTGATGTIAHGLSAVPKWMLIKNRDVADAWAVYHGALTAAPATDYIVISSAAATVDDATYWNDTAPTSSVFTVNTVHNVNANGEKYVAYVFAEVDGYSQFGGYTGNGSADGPMVFTGFSPAWVMIKCSSNGSTNWFILDNKRDVNNEVLKDLTANTSAEEADNSNFLDFLSNGFKLRTTGAAVNGAGRTMIYMAFAEAPFKYANAK